MSSSALLLRVAWLSGPFWAAATEEPRPCDVAPGLDQPWCDASLSLDERVADLIRRIPDSDIPGLLTTPLLTSGVPSLKIPAVKWWNEGLHGVGFSPGVSFRGETPAATSFPQVVTTSMSFNSSLFRRIGAAIGTEIRVFSNQGNAGLTIWTPNVNIFRDPRWGRGQETPGEDPTLTARYAVEFVRGVQEGEDSTHLKASACLKHFTAYDLEKWGGTSRHRFDAKVSEQDLAETFNVPFEAGVKEGRASCIMCSYNSVNGVPSCANGPLLTGLARQTWGFDGYISSDCGAVVDVPVHHGYNTANGTCSAVLGAGMDIDCGPYLYGALGQAMKKGQVPRAMADQALSHLFRVQMRLGLFDPADSQPYVNYGTERVNSKGHQELALDAARQGMVLLKNVNGTLPLDKQRAKKIALIGPAGKRDDILQGNYYGKAPFLVTIADGLESYADVTQVAGCSGPPEIVNLYHLDFSTSSVACSIVLNGFSKAEKAATAADATVIVVGLDPAQEAEGHDRTHLKLPGRQQELAEKAAAASKGPVILVVMAGGSVDVAFARDSDAFDAVLFIGYPGQAAGQALAETLFGDSNPSGRLTQTFYPASYIEEWADPSTSYFDMGMRPDPKGTGNPGRGYRFYTGEPVFKFGEGLSYTTFAYSMPETLPAGEARVLPVTVHNTGGRRGRHAVLAFVEPPAGPAAGPRTLRQFDVLDLGAGEARVVELRFAAEDFQTVDSTGARMTPTGDWKIFVGDQVAVARVESKDGAALLV